jgi:TrmH family RNA methyltransferase
LGGTRTITSRDNPSFKALKALATDSRELRRQGKTLLDGPHLVATYRNRIGLPELVVVSESGLAHGEVGPLLAALAPVDVLHLPDKLFREISSVATPVGILAVIAIPAEPVEAPRGSCVLLDAIQDAGNVGTIMRSAAAAGVGEIALGAGCAGAWTPRVLRAAQGAHFSLRIREQADLAALARSYGTASLAAVPGGGTSIYDLDLGDDIAWIFGNEGTGITAPVAMAAGRRVTIPMAGDSESLNVAAAAAVCLFEAMRQRSARGGVQ